MSHNQETPVYHLSDMTWEEVKDALITVQLAIIPIGSHEQHGPHMVESCDAVLATEIAKKLAAVLHPFVLVTPTINMGVSNHHMHFPGTLTLEPATLVALLKDMVGSLKQHGIKKVLFLNGHGGNQSTLDVACTTLTKALQVDIYYAKTTASAKKAIGSYVTSELFGHSCEREVSEALYLAPEMVRMSKITKGEIQHGRTWEHLRPGSVIRGFYSYEEMTANGCIGNATKATADIGEKIVEESIENLASELRKILNLQVTSFS